MAEGFDVEEAAVDEAHQIQRGEVAGRIVQEHVFGAGVGGVDAIGVFGGVPAVDGGVELHAGVAALPGGFGEGAHEIAGAEFLDVFAVDDGFGPPVLVAGDGLHELVGGADAVVGVLEKDGGVGLAVEGLVVAGVDEGVGFFLFLGLAPDELLDVGVFGVEDDHFGGAAGAAASG